MCVFTCNRSDPGNNCVSAMPLMGYKWTVENCPNENEYVCERPQGTSLARVGRQSLACCVGILHIWMDGWMDG